MLFIIIKANWFKRSFKRLLIFLVLFEKKKKKPGRTKITRAIIVEGGGDSPPTFSILVYASQTTCNKEWTHIYSFIKKIQKKYLKNIFHPSHCIKKITKKIRRGMLTYLQPFCVWKGLWKILSMLVTMECLKKLFFY